MCGRFGINSSAEQLALLLEIDPSEVPKMHARFNIAPSTKAPIVRHNATATRKVHWVRWGLIPSWAPSRSMGHKLINARAESVTEKPAFRDAFMRRRCLVMSDGFYEWKQGEGDTDTQAFHIGLNDESPFAMAGLWERHNIPESGDALDTFTIITTKANRTLAPIHHRMPVILAPSNYETWLSRDSESRAVLNLMRPCPDEVLVTWPVSSLVNNPKHDTPACRKALPDGPGREARARKDPRARD